MPVDLLTAEGESLSGIPWQTHPQPQMKRDSWLNLNGGWDFAVNYESLGQIRLPFCPESRLSCIGKHFDEASILSYTRVFTLPEGFNRGRVLLHIGAADQRADVFVNGKPAGSHQGGYEAFAVDISAFLLPEENRIQILCSDDLEDISYPRGKQVLPEKRGGMWYTPVSGIWQSVWLESVPEAYIEKMTIENRAASVRIAVEPALDGMVHVPELGSFPLENGTVVITPENPRFWCPDDPFLYDFTVEAGEDRVESYFAIRTLEIQKVGKFPRLCLNGKPFFFHGLLDQGYWPDGLFLPATPEGYARDILAMKKLGFNTLRKHIKVEPEEFYYQCDKLGMIVWQDMVSNGEYSYARDTALPTVLRSYQRRSDRSLNRDPLAQKRFIQGMTAAVNQLRNHPCICCWTVFNEGWGQFDSDSVFEQLRALDDTRFIDTTSGWFRRKKSDVDSRHVYFRKANLKGNGVKPLVLSEFGGKTHRVEGHLFNPEKTYGYGGCDSPDAFNDTVAKLYTEEVIPSVKRGLCAAIYTQLSDVEDEINGLVTYDRKVEKIQPETLLPIAQALQQAVRENKKVAFLHRMG